MENEENKVVFDLKRVPLQSEREEIRNRRRKTFLIVLLCLFCLILGILLGHIFLPRERVIGTGSSSVEEIKQIMGKYWLYGDQYDDLSGELEDKALYGMTAFDFDPYTSYMSAEEMNSFSDSINLTYVGIGVEYSYVNDAAMIMKVFKYSPAEKAGLQAGDCIIQIDSTPVEGLDTMAIRELVLGEEGTIVTLKIERENKTLDVEVVRGVVDSTVYAYTEDDYIIMELNSFGETTAIEAAKYLDAYKDYEKIIIDLRDDSGGYQSSVRDICGLFMGPDQVYLRQKGSNGVEMVDKTPSSSRKYDNLKKIIVLAGRDTASAAEVLTIALREKCDALVVGETTYGKGVIQTNRVLRNGGVLKITTYYWYSPDGNSIDKVGIVPDEEVKMPDIYYELYSDMEDGEEYAFDSVSDKTALCQKALRFLGYDVERDDGYFDRSFGEALIEYKGEHGLSAIALLDKDTYGSIIAETRYQLSNDRSKDTVLNRAIEIMKED